QENLYPRFLISHNRVVLVEFFRKITPEEQEQNEREAEKLTELAQAAKPFSESSPDSNTEQEI
ncbi:MAG: hypothetical protein DRO88_08725, partial [Promethearchaeia archaeon]